MKSFKGSLQTSGSFMRDGGCPTGDKMPKIKENRCRIIFIARWLVCLFYWLQSVGGQLWQSKHRMFFNFYLLQHG